MLGAGAGKTRSRRGRGWDVNIHPRQFWGRGAKWGVGGGSGINKTRPRLTRLSCLITI